MKNFSFKALGAFIFAAGLVVAGVAAPAQAAVTIAWNGTAPTFIAGASPAMSINFTPTSPTATFRQVNISIRNSLNSVPMGVTTAALSSGSLAGCKITGINGANVEPQSNSCTNYNQQDPRVSFAVADIGLGSGTAIGAFNLQVNPGLFTGLSAGTYYVWVATSNDSTIVESATLAFTIAAAPTAALSPSSLTITGSANSAINPTTAFTASNFVGAVTYTAFNLPAGLNINQSTGVISGTPNAATVMGAPTPTVRAAGATSGLVLVTVIMNISASGSGGGSGGGGSSATATITLGASTGQLVSGSTVAIVASGLQATAPYEVVVRSTPQTIGTGNAVSGAVNSSVTLPAGLEAGWHSLTFTSTAADGSAMTSVAYFKVSASGTLLATSSTIPAELANTGFDALPFLATGGMLALAGATLMLFARRRYSN